MSKEEAPSVPGKTSAPDAAERELWYLRVCYAGQGLGIAVPICPQGWNVELELDPGISFYTGPFSIQLDPDGTLQAEGMSVHGGLLLPTGSQTRLSRELPPADRESLRALSAELGSLCGWVGRADSPQLRIELTSDCICQSWLRRLVKGFLGPLQLDLRDVYRLQLAVDEAFTNIIRHAYGECPRRPIDFELVHTDGLLTACFTDAGERRPDVDKLRFDLPAETRPGGRGLFILREVFDEVEFDTQRQTGTCLRLAKRLQLET